MHFDSSHLQTRPTFYFVSVGFQPSVNISENPSKPQNPAPRSNLLIILAVWHFLLAELFSKMRQLITKSLFSLFGVRERSKRMQQHVHSKGWYHFSFVNIWHISRKLMPRDIGSKSNGVSFDSVKTWINIQLSSTKWKYLTLMLKWNTCPLI